MGAVSDSVWTRSPLLLIAMLALSLPGAAAQAQTTLDVPVWDGGNPHVEGPVVTNDGTVVVGLSTTPGHFNIEAFPPTLDDRHTLMSYGRTSRRYPGRDIGLTAAGPGVLVADDVYYVWVHCCATNFGHSAVTWFPAIDQPAHVISDCAAPCGYTSWDPPLWFTASDGARAFIFAESGETSAYVRDLASGAQSRVSLDQGGGRPSTGIYGPQIAGNLLTYPPTGEVVNWQTGEVVHRFEQLTAHALLADGTMVYEDRSPWSDADHLLYLAPGGSDPTPLPHAGELVAAAANRLLVQTVNGLQIWTPEGALVADFGSLPLPSAAVAFDGSRLVTVQAFCMTARIQIREPGQPAGEPLSNLCATPVPGTAKLTRHAATVKVSCPEQYAQGCIGDVHLLKPAPPGTTPVKVFLHPGETTTVRLAHWKRTSVCASARRVKRWIFRVDTPAGFYTSMTPFRVGRHVNCSAPAA